MIKAIIILLITGHALGHGNSKHGKLESHPKTPPKTDDALKAAYDNINTSYKKTIEPIFKGKCFDCHSTQTVHPWYYQIPGVNMFMNYHIQEGRSHLDMEKGFPFKGHGSPQEDLSEIEKSVKEDSMPPRSYRLLHGNSSLTKKETKLIIEWVRNSQEQLKDVK